LTTSTFLQLYIKKVPTQTQVHQSNRKKHRETVIVTYRGVLQQRSVVTMIETRRRMATRNAKDINKIRWTESVWFPCAGGHGGPPLHRIHRRHRNQIQHPAPQRDARWDVEREGRETKVSQPTRMEPVCTGDFGTSARLTPRERVESTISKLLPREGVAALPYTETSVH
jgi:hypothetical protein